MNEQKSCGEKGERPVHGGGAFLNVSADEGGRAPLFIDASEFAIEQVVNGRAFNRLVIISSLNTSSDQVVTQTNRENMFETVKLASISVRQFCNHVEQLMIIKHGRSPDGFVSCCSV